MKKLGGSHALCLGDFLNAARRTLEPFGRSEEMETRRFGKAYLRQLGKLTTSVRSRDAGQTRKRVHTFFRSPGTKLAAALLAYPKCQKRRFSKRQNRRPKISLDALKALAREVSVYQPSGEPIRVTKIRKPGGGERTIASFGRRTRAAQRLALDAMRAMHGDSEFEYARKGRGREVFVEQILPSIQHRGVRYVAEADVKDFFPSVDRNAVSHSGLLPKSVLKAAVLMEGLDEIHTETKHKISPNSDRVGLWQGAIASPFVASKIIEPALAPLRCRLGQIYIDNIVVGGRTVEETEVHLDTLAQRLAEHPAGPFQLKYRRVTRIGGDHDLLGYRVARDAPQFGSLPRAKPSRPAICKQQRKLLTRLIFADFATYGAETERWAISWPQHYPLWAGHRHAQEQAEITAMDDVWPIAWRARQHIQDARVAFKSFDELGKLGSMFTPWLLPEPDWGAIESDVIQTASTTRIKKSYRSANQYPPSSYIDVIRRYLSERCCY